MGAKSRGERDIAPPILSLARSHTKVQDSGVGWRVWTAQQVHTRRESQGQRVPPGESRMILFICFITLDTGPRRPSGLEGSAGDCPGLLHRTMVRAAVSRWATSNLK